MDPATLSALVRLGIELTGAVVKIFRAAGHEATAAEIEAILQRADTVSQSVIDRANAELGLVSPPPPVPPPTPEPPPATVELALVTALRRLYPVQLTPEQCVLLTNAICLRLNGGAATPWVLQRAPYGVDEAWQGIALDRITDYRQVIRVLGRAETGAATPEWTEVREGPHGAPVHVDWPLAPVLVPVPADPDWEDS